jgi:peptidoglycan/xylan/chitin deacetylase (PgdA/CDA1 family)
MGHKIAYLTIDDAPSQSFKQKAGYLSMKGIPAVFFCLGALLEERPDQAIDAIQKGFILGNHSYDHPFFSDLSLVQCCEQIRRTDEIIERLYQAARVKRQAKYFRFPYGDKGGLKYSEVLDPYDAEGAARKAAIQAFLTQSGYSQPRFERITYAYYRNAGLLEDVDWYWTYDVMEWSIFTEPHEHGIDSLEKVFERMEENEPEGCRGLNYFSSEDILLLHDQPESDDLFVPIVERLLSRGIAFRSTLF